MAQFLQSEVRLIHSIETTKPTDSETPTDAKGIDDENGTPLDKAKKKEDGSKILGMLGRASVVRRMANMALSAGESLINREFDKAIFAQSFSGNTRGAEKIQNFKTEINSYTNVAKSGVGAVVTTVALKNPIIAITYFAGEMLKIAQNYANYQVQLSQYNDKRNLDIFLSEKRKDRLYFNSYNRRTN